MAIRCKMRLDSVLPMAYAGATATFRCEYDAKLCAEDASFQKAAPSGEARFQIDNPRAYEQLVVGATYYFDITLADKEGA